MTDEQAADMRDDERIPDAIKRAEDGLALAESGMATEDEMMRVYEEATGHKVEQTSTIGDGVCSEYDPSGPNAIMPDGAPQCAICGYEKSEHGAAVLADGEPELTTEERDDVAAIQAQITPESMMMPFVMRQQEVTTPDGKILIQYVMGFVNQSGKVLAHPGVDGAMQLATLSFANDTGRRSIAWRRPRGQEIVRGYKPQNGLHLR